MAGRTSFGSAVWRLSPARLAVLVGAPVAVTIAAWIYLSLMIGDMSTIPGMSSVMKTPQPSDLALLFGLFAMWSVMMAAMMLPTAAPMIMAYAYMQSSDRARGAGWRPVFAFSGGYVLAWVGFSLGAAVLQNLLTELWFMSPMMMKIVSEPIAGIIFIAAGVYQFTNLKQTCLRKCQSPTGFLMTQWREGVWGAVWMGGRHGIYCVGCCWALMGLLFVAGVMSAPWIVAITVYVLIEKIAPRGQLISQLTGAGMLVAGIWVLL